MSLNGHKPLYQPWNEDEFRSDPGVQSMNETERWLYRTLLNAAFFCSTRPYLPDDDAQLWILAGCDTIKTWSEHKNIVLAMFKKVRIGKDNLLMRKRLVNDWKRLVKKRKELSKKGKKGGLASAQAKAQAYAQAEREVKVSEVKEKEEVKEVSEDDMSFKSKITDKAREILGTRISPQDHAWDEMRSLARIYRQAPVEDAFDDWANTRRGETLAYPLSEFVKVADGLLRGITTVIAAPEAKDLVNELVFMCNGEITFDQKQQIQIGKMLSQWNEIDIKSAFREFYGQIEGDDFALKFGAKNFVEKAEQLLTLQKRRQDDAKKQNELTVRIMNEQRQQAEQDIENAKKRVQDEESLIEDTL